VLLLTDDLLCMYRVNSRSVTLINSYNWRSSDFEGDVAAALNLEVGDGSVYILNDTVEQHYRKEKINKLNFFDRGSIINRRLNIAFPSYPTRAALELKEKTRAGARGAKENLFLFTAVPSSEALRKLLEAVRRSNAIIASYSLLPVESVDLVEKMAARVAKENRQESRSSWSILIGQHQGGGLRQIVTKGGQIALTRITPVVTPVGENAAQWANEVVQEIQATISYLGRFGYSQNDGLDIILIGKPDLGTLVEDMISIPCHFSSLTLQRAAELAGVSVGRKQEQFYAETLHLAWYAKKTRVALAMKSKEMDAVAVPRKAAFFGMLLLTAGIGYFAFNLSQETVALRGAQKTLEKVNEMNIQAEQMYQDELKRKESLGIDVKLIQGSLGIASEYRALDFDPIPVLEVVGEGLKKLRINGMTMEAKLPEPVSPEAAQSGGGQMGTFRNVELKLLFEFPGTIKPEKGNEELDQLRRRIAPKLAGYNVSVSKELQDMTYKGSLTDETGLTATKRGASEVYTGEITIRKEISLQKDEANASSGT